VNYNFILALFAKYTSMSPEEAEAIAELLNHSIQPARYEEAVRLVEKVITDLPDK
jgi:hypothetical protein